MKERENMQFIVVLYKCATLMVKWSLWCEGKQEIKDNTKGGGGFGQRCKHFEDGLIVHKD